MFCHLKFTSTTCLQVSTQSAVRIACLTCNFAHCVTNAAAQAPKSQNPNPEGLIDYAVENETHVSVFPSTFRDILDSRRRQGRLGGLRILAGRLKPFGAGPY